MPTLVMMENSAGPVKVTPGMPKAVSSVPAETMTQ
ncbi:Uncharacterised protein [Bordetella pertussis]|nr:Uncharacterised protein [Bordetella pertussis]